VTPSLTTELDTIYREREEGDSESDPFNKALSTCTIIDLEETLTLEDLFHRAAEILSKEIKVGAEDVYQRLMEREKTSTTALTPEFAVPHIMIGGEKKFDILIYRSRPGVHFNSSAPQVHAIFFLTGTVDERTTHLRALAGIAQIVNNTAFTTEWLGATDTIALRTFMLSSHKPL